MSAYRFLALIVFGYLLYGLMVFVFQRHVLFPRHAIGSSSPARPADARVLWIDMAGGPPVEAWFLPPLKQVAEPFPLVIYAHGNAERIDDFPEELTFFREKGMGLLLVEYPGYGRSGGSPSQQGITEAFVRAHDQVVQWPNVDPRRVVFFGRSLGGGAVCALSHQRRPAAMILMSTFTSVRAFASRFFAPGFIIRDPFDNIAALKAYDGPVLIVHGNRDEVIDYRHALALSSANPRSHLVTLPCGHNDLAPGWYDFEAQLTVFFRQAGLQWF